MSMLVRKGTMLHRNPSRRLSRSRRSSRGSISTNSSFRNKNKGESQAASSTAGLDSSCASTSAGHADNKDRGDHCGIKSSPNGIRRYSVAEPYTVVDVELRQDPHSGHMMNGSSVYLSPKSAYSKPHYETHRLSPNSPGIPLDVFSSNRRSSSISQRSEEIIEDRRRMYRYSKFAYDSREYGSVLGQLKEASEEAKSSLDFTNKFFSIICKSAFATAFFVILAILPLSMAFIGIKNLQECPLQPNLPVYFLVCGVFGLLRVIWALYEQMKLRRYEHCNASFFEEDSLFGSTALKAIQWTLNGFIFVWFLLGNFWIAGLRGSNNGPPQYTPTLQSPNGWCSKQLYIFSISHLYVLYGLSSIFVLMWILSFIFIPIQHHFNK